MSLLRGPLSMSYLTKVHHLRQFFTRVSAQLQSKAVASFEEVKAVRTNDETVIIDVRQPEELQETGVVPCSINVPLDNVESTLKSMTAEEFLKCYGRARPDCTTPIIFTCKAGTRSEMAQEIASKLGYTNTRNYVGGWLDWAERNK